MSIVLQPHRLIFSRDDFAVMKARTPDHQTLTISGSIAGLPLGQWVKADLQEKEGKYGREYRVIGHQRVLTGLESNRLPDLEKWLVRHIPGVGKVNAEAIVSQFQDFESALDSIASNPRLLLDKVKVRRQAAAMDAWDTSAGFLQLDVVMHRAGIGTRVQQQIIAVCGGEPETIRRLREDPWGLVSRVRGVGFRTMDTVAQFLGCPTDAPQRLRAGVAYAAHELSSNFGHTVHGYKNLIAHASELLGIEVAEIDTALIGDRDNIERIGPYWAGAASLVGVERQVARIVADLRVLDGLRMNSALLDRVAAERKFDSSQRAALDILNTKAVAGLIGNPGTGKTTLVGGFVECMRRGGATVALVAPTGLAARVLSKAAGHEASTIHRWIATVENGEVDDVDMLVIEEASMLSSQLAGRLLSVARAVTSRIIFVGDGDQLPAIEPGRIFRDLIDYDAMPVVRLEYIYRQAGGSIIPFVARALRNGVHPGSLPSIGYEDAGWRLVECDTPEEVERETIVEALRQAGQFPGRTVVLSPNYERAAGVNVLGSALQGYLNPKPNQVLEGKSGRWGTGDPAMHLGNDYLADFAPLTHAMRGTVLGIQQGNGGAKARVLVGWEDGHERWHEAVDGKIPRLVLGYCLTYHRSQGSEFDGAVIALSEHNLRVVQREAIYTAVTRAKIEAVVVAQRDALEKALESLGSQRTTALQIFLKEKGRLAV